MIWAKGMSTKAAVQRFTKEKIQVFQFYVNHYIKLY